MNRLRPASAYPARVASNVSACRKFPVCASGAFHRYEVRDGAVGVGRGVMVIGPEMNGYGSRVITIHTSLFCMDG